MRFRTLSRLILLCLLSCPTLAQEISWQAPTTLKLSTKTVSLNVTVKDKKDKAVVGLNPEAFQIYENNIAQQLSFFTTAESPISWGLVLDRSDSMKENLSIVYQAALGVVGEGTDKDETFIVSFNKQAERVSDFTSDKRRLQHSIRNLRAEGSTGLWDAVSYALDAFKEAKHPKKVLVVITDGRDNNSRIAFKDLLKKAEEAEILIYTIGLIRPVTNSRWGARNRSSEREELTKLAEITGAEATFPTTLKEYQERIQAIATEVSHQYSLGLLSKRFQ